MVLKPTLGFLPPSSIEYKNLALNSAICTQHQEQTEPSPLRQKTIPALLTRIRNDKDERISQEVF